MTQQLDMMPGAIADAIEDPAALERLADRLPKPREVEPRLPLQACMHPVDALKDVFAHAGIRMHPQFEAQARAYCDEQVTYEPTLDARAREDHR